MKKHIFKRHEIINNVEYIEDAGYHICPSRKMRMAIFKCKCGKTFKSIIRSVVSGNTKSCGCFGIESRKKRFTKHGLRNHHIYSTWCMIKTRCYNKKRKDYKYYGGRGIKVSDYFLDNFMNFYNYVISLENYKNVKKYNLTIDRIDNNKNYEKGNIRWATKKQQSNNRRCNV